MISINQFLQVLEPLNVIMNATKFVLKMSQRDRFSRIAKKKGLIIWPFSLSVHTDSHGLHMNKGNAKL